MSENVTQDIENLETNVLNAEDNLSETGSLTSCEDMIVSSEIEQNLCPDGAVEQKHVWDRATVQVIQRTGADELALRIFKVSKSYIDCRKPNVNLWESMRIFINRDTAGNVKCSHYYYSYSKGILTKWQTGERPVFSHWQYNFESDICGHLYHNNLGEELAGTPWQYSQLKQFYLLDSEPMEVLPYLRAYTKYPVIEYLVKLGLGNIASDMVYRHSNPKVIKVNGKNFHEVLGVGLEDISILQKANANVNQLELYQALKKQKARFDETLLIWYETHKIRTTEHILYPLQFMSAGKLMRYTEQRFEQLKDLKTASGVRRYESIGRVLSEYQDYLQFAYKLEYDLSNSFVLFPRKLMEAHDQASGLYKTKKTENCNNLIQAAYQSLLEEYQFTRNGFTVIPPKTADEIVSEGHKLHHCISGYVEKVAEQKCIILFIRRTDNINEPFYTVELREGRVIQARGQNNGSPTPEVKKYLDLWERNILNNGRTSA